MDSLTRQKIEEVLPFFSSEMEGISSFIEQLPDVVRYDVAAQTDFVQIELEFEKNFSSIFFLLGSSSVVISPVLDDPTLLTTYIYPRFGFRFGDVAVSLQWSTDLFREAVKTSEGQFISAEVAKITPVPFCIDLGVLLIEIDNNGRLTLDLPNAFAINVEIPAPFEIANTGFILEVGEASLSLGGDDEGNDDSPSFSDFIFNVPSATVHLPEPLRFLAEEGVTVENAEFSEDGFSGVISINTNEVPEEPPRFLFGFAFNLNTFEVEFKQNAIVRTDITGTITVPYIDATVEVEVSIDLDGNVNIFARAGIDIQTGSPLPMQINRVGLVIENDSAVFEIDATLAIDNLGGLSLDPIDFQFSVDAHGNVHIDGGWIELPEQLQADFYGFQLELSRIALGQESENIRWIAFDGSLRLAEGIQAGASVKGLQLSWKGNDFQRISMDGIGIEYQVPNVIDFKGEACLTDRIFAGGIRVNLPAIGLNADGYVKFGIEDGVSYMAVQLALSLPAGIPLFSTGLAIYGMEGLFAHNQYPNVTDGKWHDWYRNAPDPRSMTLDKWAPKAGGLAFGAGMSIGTLADNGYAFSGNLLLTLVLPGPVILLEGMAGILQERASISKDPPLGCFAVLDGNDSSLLLGLNAYYKYPGSGSWEGMLIDISGDTEAFFSLSDPAAWHLYIGQITPRERRINADIFNGLFEANAYFMLQQGSLEMGASLDYGDTWKFGPLSVTLEAYLSAGAFVSLKPAQFVGQIGLGGSLGLSVFGYGISLFLETNLSAQIFTPYLISGNVHGGIKLPWPLPDFSASISLTWEEATPDSPPIPLPLQEVSIEHRQTTLTWPLTRKVPSHESDPPVTILPNYEDSNNPGYQAHLSSGDSIPDDFDTLPVVPLDGLPKITFGRSVHDVAEVGNPYNDPDPEHEEIGNPEDDVVGPQVKYDLLSLALEKYENEESGTWTTVAHKGDVNSDLDEELFGTWAPTPDIGRGRHGRSEDESLSNTKLWLWSLNPFEALGQGSGDYVQGFMGDEFSYPCSLPFIPTPDPTKEQQREDEIIKDKLQLRNESLSNQLKKFADSSPLLDPYSIYRLKIITQTTIVPETVASMEEYAYFKTEGPPGYTDLTLEKSSTGDDVVTLDTLHPYIRQTLPITVPQLGEKPIRPRPVHRAYDHAVFYNNDSSHVEQMYRQADLDLRLLLVDENGCPGYLDNGQAASLALESSERVSQHVTELNRLWLEILDGNTCSLETPASLSMETVGRVRNKALSLLPDMPYRAMLVPMLLRDDFSKVRNWWAGSMAGWNHQYHGVYEGDDARIDSGRGGNYVRLENVVPDLIDGLSSIEFKGDTARASTGYRILSSGEVRGTLLELDGEPEFSGVSSEWSISAQGSLASTSNPSQRRYCRLHAPERTNEQDPHQWSSYSIAVVFRVEDVTPTFDFSILLGIADEMRGEIRVECSRSGNLRRGTSSPRRSQIRIFDDRERRSNNLLAEKHIHLSAGLFQLTAECLGKQIRVFFNDDLIVEQQTQEPIIGSAGLSTKRADCIRFLQFEVDDLSGIQRSVYDYSFTTSNYMNFSHLISTFQDRVWTRSTESIPAEFPYEELAKMLLGDSRLQAVDAVELTHISKPNQEIGDPTWLHIASPEPLDWDRIEEVSLERLPAVSLFEPATGALKLSSLNLSEAINANDELILLIRSGIDLSGYLIECRQPNSDMQDDALNKGLVLREDNFASEDLSSWEIVDEPPYSKVESDWQVRNGILEQTSNLYGFVGGEHADPGTYAIWQDSEWSDCRLRLKLCSNDNDAIGFLFRYVDQNNYYRFSMDHERSYRRLIKKVNGNTTVLWENAEGFAVGNWYRCQMDGTGVRLRLWIDGELIFDLTDQSHAKGRIGLYCRANKGAKFDSVRVEAQPWTWAPLHTFTENSLFPDGKRIILGREARGLNDAEVWDQPSTIAYNGYSIPQHMRRRGVDLRIKSKTGEIIHQRSFSRHGGTPVALNPVVQKADGTAFFFSMETPSRDSLYRLTLSYRRQIGETQSESWQSQAGNGNPEVGRIEFSLKR